MFAPRVKAPAPAHVRQVLNSPGKPLDPATRAFFEPRFAYDFSAVRVHTDAQANESARLIDSLAYSAGTDVVFRSDSYAPATAAGQKLLAHELTHVVQQRQATAGGPFSLGTPDDAAEEQAERAADDPTSALHAASRGGTADSTPVVRRWPGPVAPPRPTPPEWLGPLRNRATHLIGDVWEVQITGLGRVPVGPYDQLRDYLAAFNQNRPAGAEVMESAHIIGGEHMRDLGWTMPYDKAPCIGVQRSLHSTWSTKVSNLQSKQGPMGGRATRTVGRPIVGPRDVKDVYNEVYEAFPELRDMSGRIVDLELKRIKDTIGMPRPQSPIDVHQGGMPERKSPMDAHQGGMPERKSPMDAHQGGMPERKPPMDVHQGGMPRQDVLKDFSVLEAKTTSRLGRFAARLAKVGEIAGPFLDAALMVLSYSDVAIDASAFPKLSAEKLGPILEKELKARNAEVTKLGEAMEGFFGVYANVRCELHYRYMSDATGKSLGGLQLYDVRYQSMNISGEPVTRAEWDAERGRKEQHAVQQMTIAVMVYVPSHPQFFPSSEPENTDPLYFTSSVQRSSMPAPISTDALLQWARRTHPGLLDDPGLATDILSSHEFTGSPRARERAVNDLRLRIRQKKL